MDFTKGEGDTKIDMCYLMITVGIPCECVTRETRPTKLQAVGPIAPR